MIPSIEGSVAEAGFESTSIQSQNKTWELFLLHLGRKVIK
jgi:hypothetical protein